MIPDVAGSDRGGAAALRGFRLQSLYILYRTLTALGDDELLQPEGIEDLGVLRAGRLREACQVKALAQPLTLSDLEPDKKGGFVQRQIRRLRGQPDLVIRIASYGPIGPELARAVGPTGTGRERIRRRLVELGIGEPDADLLLDRLVLDQVDEAELTTAIAGRLAETLTGHDSRSALEVLLFWIHHVSERQETIDAAGVLKRVSSVGAYLADRAAHATEWFTTIEPLEDRAVTRDERSRLLAEFDVGVAARYEHVLAGAAIARPAMLKALGDGLARSRVVVVHGASGEGKSTLALAFLATLPAVWRFRVREVESRARAASIARALLGHAQALGLPVYVHLDVGPSDTGWTVVARELSRDPEVRVVVTVREEDWRRASLQGEFQFEELEVALLEEEARGIYSPLRGRHADAPLTFDEAWGRFGAAPGPLLEFVHLCTQGQGLEERLASQVGRLRDEVRTGQATPAELDLLRLVAVAGAYEAAVDAQLVIESLGLPDPHRTVDRFEREYLIRRDTDGLVTGLHPIRSQILVRLLCDQTYSPWAPAAAAVLPAVAPAHLERFLLYAFSRRPELDRLELLTAVLRLRCRTWEQAGGIGRALLWRGLANYVEENRTVIEALRARYPGYWYLMLNWDVALLGTDTAGGILENLAGISEAFANAKASAADLSAQQTDPQRSYARFREWVEVCPGWPDAAPSGRDWPSLGDLLFWSHHLGIAVHWLDEVDGSGWPAFISDGSIEDVATAARGIAMSSPPTWYTDTAGLLARRYREATASPVLVDQDGEVRIDFILDVGSPAGGNDPHAATMWRIGLLRRLFPDREKYSCQGHGHRLFDGAVDGTHKAIPAKNLPHDPLASRNGSFLNLAELWWRAPGWSDYWQQAMAQRQRAVEAGERVTSLIAAYFRRPAGGMDGPAVDEVVAALAAIGDPGRLPRVAVDEWGFVSESTAKGGERPQSTAGSGIALEQFAPYRKAHHDYLTGWDAFSRQASHALILWPVLARSSDAAGVREQARTAGVDEDLARLSLVNLANAAAALPRLGRESTKLVPTPLAEALASLCAAERAATDAALLAWQALSTLRHERTPTIVADQRARRDHLLRRVRSAIAANLRSSVPGAHWSVRPGSIVYEGEAAFLIEGDWTRDTDALATIGTAGAAIARALRGLDDANKQTLVHVVPNIVVAQLIRGRLARPEVVVVPTHVLCYGNEDPKWFNLVPKAVDSATLAGWDLAGWEEPSLGLGDPLLVAAVETYFYLRHIGDLAIEDALDDVGTAIVQRHVDNVSRAAQEHVGRVVEHGRRMIELLLDRGDVASAEGLRDVLVEFADAIGEGFRISDLAPVLEHAERVVTAATVARAIWFDMVLEDLRSSGA